MELAFAIILPVAFIVIAVLLVRKGSSAPATSTESNIVAHPPASSPKRSERFVEILSCELSPDGYRSWQNLLSIKLGDAKGARELVLLEKRRSPNDSMDALIESAVYNWRRENP